MQGRTVVGVNSRGGGGTVVSCVPLSSKNCCINKNKCSPQSFLLTKSVLPKVFFSQKVFFPKCSPLKCYSLKKCSPHSVFPLECVLPHRSFPPLIVSNSVSWNGLRSVFRLLEGRSLARFWSAQSFL